MNDHHGTGSLAINAATLAATRRRLDPFGNPRISSAISWPSTRGFVGGTKDDTGLTHLGAREYEPGTGRFISDDSVTNAQDPQQINGYSYAANSPVTSSDPSGLCPKDRCPGWGQNPGTSTGDKGSWADDPDGDGDYQPKTLGEKYEDLTKDLLKEHRDQVGIYEVRWGTSLCDAMGLAATCKDVGVYTTSWCLEFGLINCIFALRAGMRATSAADAMYEDLIKAGVKKEVAQGKQNAYHHALWMAIMVGELHYSDEEALMLGMAHERDNSHEEHTWPSRQSQIDMNNNMVGAATATRMVEQRRQEGINNPRPNPGGKLGGLPYGGYQAPVSEDIDIEIRRQVLECATCLDLTGY